MEESHWKRVVSGRFHLEELYQPAMTHASASGRSRLDRVYTTQRVSDQLDRQVRSAALEWVPHLSAHRAVALTRSTTVRSGEVGAPPNEAFQHPDWGPRATAEYWRLVGESPNVSDVGKLRLLVQAMNTAAERATQ